jgi:vitamin B12 transporter
MTGVPGTPAASPRVPDDVLSEPQILRKVEPPYPQAAVSAELEGEVILEGVVGIDGRVREITVRQSVHPLLDEAARKAWQQCEYRPARRNGRPEPARIVHRVQFVLKELRPL